MSRIAVFARDFAGILGLGLVSSGAWMVYRPAGYIVAGVILIAGALILSRKPAG